MNPKIRSVNTTASRRPKLSKDILALLERQPHMTQAQIARELKAKPHSLKAVLWKLVQRQNKVVAARGAASELRGPKIVNIYCLASTPEGQS